MSLVLILPAALCPRSAISCSTLPISWTWLPRFLCSTRTLLHSLPLSLPLPLSLSLCTHLLNWWKLTKAKTLLACFASSPRCWLLPCFLFLFFFFLLVAASALLWVLLFCRAALSFILRDAAAAVAVAEAATTPTAAEANDAAAVAAAVPFHFKAATKTSTATAMMQQSQKEE